MTFMSKIDYFKKKKIHEKGQISDSRDYLGYVWFPENTKERKKMQRKIIFSCLVVL